VARGKTEFCAAHGGGVRCKAANCNKLAIGTQQLCRTHSGGSRGSNGLNSYNDDGDEDEDFEDGSIGMFSPDADRSLSPTLGSKSHQPRNPSISNNLSKRAKLS
jgi:hypothetical protein